MNKSLSRRQTLPLLSEFTGGGSLSRRKLSAANKMAVKTLVLLGAHVLCPS
jgi:hypothetical protein